MSILILSGGCKLNLNGCSTLLDKCTHEWLLAIDEDFTFYKEVYLRTPQAAVFRICYASKASLGLCLAVPFALERGSDGGCAVCCSIELQLQEVNPALRSGVYSHLEAFVPCNKDTLIKRLKKLHLNVQVSMGTAGVTSRQPGLDAEYSSSYTASKQARCFGSVAR